ncbi:unnamed protein product [Didymodactylos carnosus]|uniref:Uncharacterized protein n=1 Tax=Didymodactylos carnosus TaxID=1234261 RepID=A0A815I1K6_9BILA|nr:unnamed protein product [Didymodactylos carnosus]CAF1362417.1 unnamed protein product [Didymodactylos carnosus]CAF3808773.1 unnamed protein product [Didymodactylos carnosus]CAF4242111.1 unnamed protein product [Didymodactylos carnosus]
MHSKSPVIYTTDTSAVPGQFGVDYSTLNLPRTSVVYPPTGSHVPPSSTFTPHPPAHRIATSLYTAPAYHSDGGGITQYWTTTTQWQTNWPRVPIILLAIVQLFLTIGVFALEILNIYFYVTAYIFDGYGITLPSGAYAYKFTGIWCSVFFTITWISMMALGEILKKKPLFPLRCI